jgi:hypothetical protein
VGLDECMASDGCRAHPITEILATQTTGKVSVFATTRHIPEIVERFDGSYQLEIRTSKHDIRRYIDDRISLLPSFIMSRKDLKEEIKSSVVRGR